MTHHDLYAKTDDNGTVYVCAVCGVVFSDISTVNDLNADECSGGVCATITTHNGLETTFVYDIQSQDEGFDVMSSLTGYAEGDACRIPYNPDTFVTDFVALQRQIRNGGNLIDAWEKGQ